jgi:phosphomannomutase/phosphoglucomutase
MRVAPSIFREYDVRGRIDGELTPEAARLIGRAFGSEMRRRGTRGACALARHGEVAVGNLD